MNTTDSSHQSFGGERTFIEWIEVGGEQLVATVKQLVQDGNVRQIRLRDSNGKELFTVPLTAGVAVGGLAVLAAPTLAAIGAITALVTRVTLEVERTDLPPQAGANPQAGGAPQGHGAPHAPGTPASQDSDEPLRGDIVS